MSPMPLPSEQKGGEGYFPIKGNDKYRASERKGGVLDHFFVPANQIPPSTTTSSSSSSS